MKTVPHSKKIFPEEKLETSLSWKDLRVNNEAMEKIKDLEDWLNKKEKILKIGERGEIQRYHVLFYGLKGTGKTLTATLLGKKTKSPVYRIDLSKLISKYIGETEKNLSSLFERATNKNWILFFDEADALFGKRTDINDSHDRYANQEVSYLLSLMENYPGLIILASNFKGNIDEGFIRRLHAVIEFKAP